MGFCQAERLLGLGSPEDVYFVNKDTALLAISERAIAVTYDGWDSFHYAELRDFQNTERNLIRTVTMNEHGIGYVAGAGGCVWKTSDFGKSFQIIRGNGGGSGGGHKIRFLDNDHLLYSGSFYLEKTEMDLNYHQVVTTLGYDGVFKQQFKGGFMTIADDMVKYVSPNLEITEFEQPYSTFDFRDASYIDSNLIYAIQSSSFVKLNANSQVLESTTMTSNYAIEFVNKDTGIVSSSHGIRVTHDAGTNWIFISEDSLEHQFGYAFNQLYTIRWVSEHDVYLFGDFGAILHSGDAGLTWELKYFFGTQNDLSDVVSDTLGNLYVGAFGGVGISNDSGNTWTYKQHLPAGSYAQEFTSIHHWSPDRAIATSNSGNTLKTNNSWDSASITLTDNFYDIAFATDALGFGVGYNAWYLTTDSGNSWTALSGLQTVDGNNIEFYNAYLGMSATDQGVYISTDSGSSWTQNSFASYIEDVTIIEDSLAYAISKAGGIYRSTNQGSSWSIIHTMGVYGRGVAGLGQNKVIGVGHDGGVSISSDGGNTWHKMTLGEYANMVEVTYHHNNFFISDDYCAVFRMDSCLAVIQPREDTLCDESELVLDVVGLPTGNKTWTINGHFLTSGSFDSVVVSNPKKGDMLSVSAGNCRADHVIKTVVYNSELNITTTKTNAFEQDSLFCGGSKTLKAPYGQSYNWSTGSTSSNLNISSAGTYTVTVTTPCTTFTKSITIDSLSPPAISILEDTICVFNIHEVDFVSTNGHLYNWQIGGSNVFVSTPFDSVPGIIYTGNATTPSPFSREVTLQVIDTNTGCSSTEEFDLRIQSHHNGFEANNYFGCDGDTADLLGGYPLYSEYNWWIADLDTTFQEWVTTSGSYLTLYESACGIYSDTSHVIIHTPDAGINETDTAICDSALLQFTSNVVAENVVWLNTTPLDTLFYDGFNYNNGTNGSSMWSTTSSYSYCTSCMVVQDGQLKATAHSNGTTTTTFTSETIVASPQEALVFTMDAWEAMNLESSSEYFSVIVYGWEAGNTRIDTLTKQYSIYPEAITGDFDSMQVLGVLEPGYDSLYFVLKAKVHDDADHYSFDNILVTQHQAWSDTNAVQYVVNNTHSLALYAHSNYCTYIDTVTVEVESSEPIVLSSASQGCDGDSLELSISSNFSTIVWSNGATTPTITLTDSDTIYATLSNSCGFINSDTVYVPFYDIPTAEIIGHETSCTNHLDTLLATGGNSYIWSTGSNDSIITISPSVLTQYSVTVFDANCFAVDSIIVEPVIPPAAIITSVNSACLGDTVTFTSGSDTVLFHSWFNGDSGLITSTIYNGQNPFSLIVFDGECADTVQKTIQTLPQPSFLDVPEDTTICLGDSITLIANGSGNVSWPPISNLNTINVAPESDTIFVAKAQIACARYDTVYIEVKPVPQVSINGSSGFCEGETLELTSTEGYQSYMWDDGTNNSTRFVSPIDTTLYTLIVFDGMCYGFDEHLVYPHANANATFLATFGGDSVKFDWTNLDTNAQFIWDFGDGTNETSQTSGTYHYSQPGTYTVCLTVYGPCNNDSNCTEVLLGESSESLRQSVYLHPNPARTNFRVVSESDDIRAIDIRDITGALIHRSTYPIQRDFDTTKWPAAMYFITVYSNDTTTTLKLVVQK